MKSRLFNLAIVTLSIVVTLIFGEFAARLFLDPIDFLMPALSKDSNLGHRIIPFSANHDAWGFRNTHVPEQADIITIGDSQTYSLSSTHKSSWPVLYSKQTNQTVYNLSLGGYGPGQYNWLLNNLAFKLKPKHILYCVYLGNDLMDAFNYVYSNDNLKSLQDPALRTDPKQETKAIHPKKRFASLRNTLANKSVIYRALTQHVLVGLKNRINVHETPEKHRLDVKDSSGDTLTVITSARVRHFAMNLKKKEIQEGKMLTKAFIIAAKKACQSRDIAFTVLLIPTKISAYEIPLRRSQMLPKKIKHILNYESQIKTDLSRFLTKHRIDHIDLLPVLQKAVSEKKAIYPLVDGHLNKAGNTIVANYLSKQP